MHSGYTEISNVSSTRTNVQVPRYFTKGGGAICIVYKWTLRGQTFLLRHGPGSTHTYDEGLWHVQLGHSLAFHARRASLRSSSIPTNRKTLVRKPPSLRYHSFFLARHSFSCCLVFPTLPCGRYIVQITSMHSTLRSYRR